MPAPLPLADLMGTPRPIDLAGASYMIAPMTVGDLADLGAFAMGRAVGAGPDAIDRAAAVPADAPQADRAAALRAAQDFAEAPPPDPGTPGYRDATACPEGLAWTAYVALRRHNPGFDLPAAFALVARLAADDPAAVGRLMRRAYGTHPARAFAALVDPDDRPEAADWPALVDRVSRDRGWPYAVIRDMTLPALWNVVNKGKPIGVEYRPRRGESTSGLRRRIRAMLGID